MLLPVTGLYVGLTILLAIVLGMRVGLTRGATGISIGDGDSEDLALKVRHHANLLETAALTLLAMAIVEANGASSWVLHAAGVCYLIARLAHPFGLRAGDITHPLRPVGAAGSMLVMLSLSLIAIFQFFGGNV